MPTTIGATAPVLAPARWRADVLVALVVGLEMQVELLFVDAPRRDVLAGSALVLALAVALALRRRMPLAAVALVVLAVDGMELIDPAVSDNLIGPFFVVLAVAYSLGANCDGVRLVAGTAMLLLGGLAAAALDDLPVSLDDLLFLVAIMVGGPLVLGRVVRARGELNRALQEKAAAAEHDREARAAAAVVDERARIAGELHQQVTAALGAMVVQAEAAERMTRTEPHGAEGAFGAIETLGRDALAEIRLLLGVLRRDDEELALAPQPSLAHLADLVARMRAGGLDVELDVTGEPPTLPAGVDLTAYRLVQEALGEARERATVRLRYGSDELLLEVIDDAGARERPLLGMHERIALYGGELVTDGRAVRARLPLAGAA